MEDIIKVLKILNKRKSAIQKAIEALEEFQPQELKNPRKRHFSIEGRRRLIQANKRRWAKYRAQKKKTGGKKQ